MILMMIVVSSCFCRLTVVSPHILWRHVIKLPSRKKCLLGGMKKRKEREKHVAFVSYLLYTTHHHKLRWWRLFKPTHMRVWYYMHHVMKLLNFKETMQRSMCIKIKESKLQFTRQKQGFV